jgi:hypothetical protein
METVSLAGVVGLGAAGIAWAVAWYSVRCRQLEFDALGPDGLAARTLTSMLVECNASPEVVQDVITLFRGLPPERGRELVRAVEGFVLSTLHRPSAGSKVVMVARAMAGVGAGPATGV